MSNRRLTRSDNRIVAGVCAGFAEYFDHDPTWWRLAFALLLIATAFFPALLFYILAWIVMPPQYARVIETEFDERR